MECCSTKMSSSEFDDWRTFISFIDFFGCIFETGLKVINKNITRGDKVALHLIVLGVKLFVGLFVC